MKRIIALILAVLLTAGALPAVLAQEKVSLGNVFILGDSYSTFEGYMPPDHGSYYNPARPELSDLTDVSQTWWRLLIDNTDSNLVLNTSWTGTAICHTGYDGKDFSGISFIARLDKYFEQNFFVGKSIDTFLIFGGTNDSAANAPIGKAQYSDWTKEDLYSALPAFCYLICKVRTELPSARPVVILNYGLKPELMHGYKDICDYTGVEYVELTDMPKIGGHPTVAGMEKICDELLEYFEKNPENTKTAQMEFKPVYRFPFTDVKENAWYRADVEKAHRMGLIDGRSLTSFAPGGTMNYAEAVKLASCLHQLHKDGKVTLANGTPTWYSTYMEYALANGIIKEDLSSLAYKKVTRRDFAKIFHASLPESEYPEINQIADDILPDVKTGDDGAEEIYCFYRAGILTGSDAYGSFKPESSITRAEVAAILTRMFDKSARKSLTLK